MGKFYFIFLTCIPSWVRLQGIDFPFTSFPACLRGPGKNGWCRDIKDCPPLLESILDIKGSNCGFRGSRPLVCCPLTVDLLETDQEKGVVLLNEQLSSPIRSFECGKGEVTENESHSASFRKERSPHANTPLPSTISSLSRTTPLPKKAWPWMVLLLENDETLQKTFFCNGVLINENYVLTTAQCVANRTNISVRLGMNYLNSKESNLEPFENFEDIQVEKSIFHPDYQADQMFHDVSLLKLSKTRDTRNALVPICLPSGTEPQEDIVNETVTLIGWTENYNDEQPFPLLLEDKATVLDPSACRDIYSDFRDYKESFPEGLKEDSFLCLDYDGTKDFCKGVYGGPVMHYRRRDETFTLAGIISTDYGCRRKNVPQIYTSIRNLATLKWIRDVTFK